jgi:hypothetical protein
LQDAAKRTTSRLTQEVLLLVLKCLDQRTRLQAAALVCHAWRAAAVAATTEVTAGLWSNAYVGGSKQHSLTKHLEKYGSAIRHLSVQFWQHGSMALPVEQLNHLKSCSISRCNITVQHHHLVAISSSSSDFVSGSSSALAGLTSLTALDLQDVSLRTCSLQELSTLTTLQRLRLVDVSDQVVGLGGQQRGTLCLQPLKQLTSVELRPLSMFPAGAVAVFSCLKKLQQLTIFDWGRKQLRSPPAGPEQEAMLAKLPLSLTKLQLVMPQVRLNRRALPVLPCLTALQHLDLGTND